MRNGQIVVLPCGDVGTIKHANASTAEVVHFDRALGRGPWVYPVSALKEADLFPADSYIKRCDRFDNQCSDEDRKRYRREERAVHRQR